MGLFGALPFFHGVPHVPHREGPARCGFDGHNVDAPVWWKVFVLLTVGLSHFLELLTLPGVDGLLRRAQRSAPAGADLHENQAVAVSEDEVYFAVGAAVVGLDECVALSLQILPGQRFALLAQEAALVRQGRSGRERR